MHNNAPYFIFYSLFTDCTTYTATATATTKQSTMFVFGARNEQSTTHTRARAHARKIERERKKYGVMCYDFKQSISRSSACSADQVPGFYFIFQSISSESLSFFALFSWLFVHVPLAYVWCACACPRARAHINTHFFFFVQEIPCNFVKKIRCCDWWWFTSHKSHITSTTTPPQLLKRAHRIW